MQEEAKNSEEEIRDREEMGKLITGTEKEKEKAAWQKEVEEKELGTREHPYIAACMHAAEIETEAETETPFHQTSFKSNNRKVTV